MFCWIKRGESLSIASYFKQAFTIDKMLKATKAQLEEIREKRLFISGLNYEGAKVQTSPNSEKLNALSHLYIELEQKYLEDCFRLEVLKIEIKGHVDKLENPTHRLIMTERYINLKHWEKIAADNGYTWRHVHKIHGRALELIKVGME